MTLTKLNYDSLMEEFCLWYYKVYNKFPERRTLYSKPTMIKYIHSLRRQYNQIARSNHK